MNAYPSCNDEREPASTSTWKHLGDCEHTFVSVDIAAPSGATITRSFEIAHTGDTVHRVAFPEGWKHTVAALGHDPSDTDLEGWLCTLAKMAFRAGHR